MVADTPAFMLAEAQVEFYRLNGFLQLDRLMDADEVEWMREVYDRLFEERAGRDAGDQFDLAGTDEEGQEAKLPQILQPSKYAPELLEAKVRAKVEAIARQLLGPEAAITGEHAIRKPAKHGAATPWHQDEAYWPPETDYKSFSVWIPLQPATLENGCMQFIPGSHRGEIVEHQPIGNDPRIHGLEVVTIDDAQAVACPLPPGGATLHDCKTLHFTGANQSDAPRRAYILVVGAPGTPRTDGRRFAWNERKHAAREDRAAAGADK